MKKRDFYELLIAANALAFGNYKTKSGRDSPYFFNFGNICSGKNLGILADIYAERLLECFANNISHLYGPAYKGIPLCVLVAERLYKLAQLDVKVTYNRKELKDHGEGGRFIGAPLGPDSKVIIIEDVLTRGTSIRESVKSIELQGASICGAFVGVDRSERGIGKYSAGKELSLEFGFPIHAIANIQEVVEYFCHENALIDESKQKYIEAYWERYAAPPS